MKEKMISYIALYFTSMLPWIEQKAGTIAIATGMDFIETFIIVMLAAATIVPLLIFFMKECIRILKKIKTFNNLLEKFEIKVSKHKVIIEKYEALGLFIIVIIPSTGMWTACFLASLLNVSPKRAIAAILLAASCVAFVYLVGSVSAMEIIDYLFNIDLMDLTINNVIIEK